jgi:magnesium chelatase family protein
VLAARLRSTGRGVRVNAELSGTTLGSTAPMTAEAAALVEVELRAGALSARGLHRVHRLARTVADLEGAGATIEAAHVREALLLRCRRQLLLGTESR